MVDVVVPVDDPSSRGLTAAWRDVSLLPALAVPATSTTVRIVLPPEVEELGLDTGLLAWVHRGSSENTPLAAADGVVTLPLADHLAGWPASPGSSLYVHVYHAASGKLVLDVALTLTSDPATAEVTVPLSLATASHVAPSDSYALGEIVAVPGTQVRMTAAPGFFAEDASSHVSISVRFVRNGISDEWWALPHVVSPDGARLTFTLPDADVEYHGIGVQVSVGDGSIRRSIGVGVLPALEEVEAYVEAVYLDLFGRAPDPQGLAGWGAALRSGTPYGAVADGITYSREFRQGLITDAYLAYLGRAPDPAGLTAWADAMDAGLHIQQMEAGFLASPEYYGVAGATDAAWVRALYQDVLGREPEAAEVDGWLPVVRQTGRVAVARAFLYSTEHLTTVVDGYYQWLLERSIDPEGARGWVAAIQSGARTEQIIAGIIASAEYRGSIPSRG